MIDNGGKYTRNEFDEISKQEDIKRQFSMAYTPQQNGLVQQINITLQEKC